MPFDVYPPAGEDAPLRPAVIEGIARVVAIDDRLAWLEPEQMTSCGGCASSMLCGDKGMGTTASRLEMRRFSLVNDHGLRVGERVIVGVSERALLKASATAYALPLATTLGAGLLAQAWVGSDGVTMVTSLIGLGVGLLAARWVAGWLGARGQLAPRFIRRAGVGESCQIR